MLFLVLMLAIPLVLVNILVLMVVAELFQKPHTVKDYPKKIKEILDARFAPSIECQKEAQSWIDKLTVPKGPTL